MFRVEYWIFNVLLLCRSVDRESKNGLFMRPLLKTALGITLFALCSFTAHAQTSRWSVAGPVFEPGPRGTFDDVSVKDPSIVFHSNVWHMVYTARGCDEYTTGYVAAGNLSELNTAPRHELTMIRGLSRYGCAPQLFLFEPQQQWYMIFQNRDFNYQPAFSTTKNISDPGSWSQPQPLLKKDSEKKWIDFWVLCDESKAYLYYTEAHSGVVVRSTSLQDFPQGWSPGNTIFTGIHEAVHVYKVSNRLEYHMIYELNQAGVRSFGLASAPHPAGPWELVTERYATVAQLSQSDGVAPWTEMVSHGEAIRSGYNQKMEYEPSGCRWLIQGIMKNQISSDYPSLPWKLGVIRKIP